MANRNVLQTPEPVVLEGYQAIMAPSKFGYTLSAIVDDEMADKLEEEREEVLKWAVSKLTNPKRSVLKPEPWEEVADGKHKVKFTWNEDHRPPVVDTEGTHITDTKLPIYSGSLVKLAFYQKPYILKDGVTYGTSLKLMAVQLVSLNSGAGVDAGDLNAEDASALFGTSKGFKVSEANVKPHLDDESTNADDDF